MQVASGVAHSGQSIRFKNDEYWKIRHMIGTYLKQMNNGIEEGTLAVWYMELVEDAIDTEEQLYAVQNRVLAVVYSMIKDGGVETRGEQSKVGRHVLALKKSATEKYE